MLESKRFQRTLVASLVCLALAASLLTGCSDVGDSSAVPSSGGNSVFDSATGSDLDSTTAVETSTGSDSGNAATPDAASGTDSGSPPTGTPDATVSDGSPGTGPNDGSSTVDTFVAETGTVGSGPEASAPETGAVVDAGGPDVQQGHEAGPPDAGTPDATIRDSGLPDAGTETSIAEAGPDAHDAGVQTGGPDAAPETGGGTGGGTLHPCLSATDSNCVQCTYSAGGTCTPTEATIVQNDIDRGFSTAPGPAATGSCYDCLGSLDCLDDTFGDSNLECEDTLATGTADQCQATLSCILQSKCAVASESVCYCGSAGLLTACQGNPAPGPIDGACASVIAAGMGFPVTDGTDITANITIGTYASGKAVEIFHCGLNNGCTACQ